GSDAEIGHAAADVPGHRFINVLVGRFLLASQKRGGGHDLPRLAVAALNDIEPVPRILHRFGHAVRLTGGQSLDGSDLLAGYRGDWRDARASRLPVKMHRTCAAQCHAAAELGTGEIEIVAQYPQQRRVRCCIDGNGLTVDVQGEHGTSGRMGVEAKCRNEAPNSLRRRRANESIWIAAWLAAHTREN